MAINLSPLGRFLSPQIQSADVQVPISWDVTFPWLPTGARSYRWNTYEQLPILERETHTNEILLQDTGGATFPILTSNDSVVEYFANFYDFTSGGETISCVDFPTFTGTADFITDVEFEGQGSTDGITAIHYTWETLDFTADILPTYGPVINQNSFITSRYGAFSTIDNNTFSLLWCYNGITLNIKTTSAVILQIYGYRLTDTSTGQAIRHYYGVPRYSGQSTPQTNRTALNVATVYCPRITL